MQNPLLVVKLLFWSCHFNLDLEYIQKIMGFSRVYYNAPILNLGDMTPLHALASVNIEGEFASREEKM